jgi:hypothetical protein
MEIVDNGVVIAIPGAMGAGLTSGLFWGSELLVVCSVFLMSSQCFSVISSDLAIRIDAP